jgi:ribosomal protein L37AE/L43A
MLEMRTLMPRVVDEITARPSCPNCGRSMHLTRMTRGTAGGPDVGTFNCGECGVWLTDAGRAQLGRPH